jgi:ribonuclease BN (tRNA processing enzyme)
VKLIVIGMSGSYAGPDSCASCYLIEHEYDGGVFRLVLDLGSGSLGPLQRHVGLSRVDAVLLSHLHPDHCLDMCGFYVARKYYSDGEVPRIPVLGPPGTADRLARAYDLPPIPGMTAEFDFQPYPEQPVTLGPFSVSAARVVHPVPAYGVRLEAGGRVLAYSGDTASCDPLVELARDADIFLCEASFLEGEDNPPDLHMTGREAGDLATRAAARRLVLTHIPPTVDGHRVLAEARPAYAGPIDLAAPGATYSLQ